MKILLSFLTLILLFACSSKKTDTELLSEARKYLAEQKIPEAVSSLEELVNDNPESNLAPEALSELASIYQNKQVKSLSDKQNLEKAIEIFTRLHDEYPKSEYAPSALFMAGFINANELQNYEAATTIYQQFLQEYPDNELTNSAQAELDNMGLTPEEILSKNLSKEE